MAWLSQSEDCQSHRSRCNWTDRPGGLSPRRSGHGGPRSRHPVTGPWRTVCSFGCPAGRGLPDPSWFAAHRGGCFRMNVHGSGHGGPPPRRPGSGPWRMVCSEGCPAEMGAGPVHGSAVGWVSRPVPVAVVPREPLPFPPLESQGLGGVWCSSPEQRLWSVLSFS